MASPLKNAPIHNASTTSKTCRDATRSSEMTTYIACWTADSSFRRYIYSVNTCTNTYRTSQQTCTHTYVHDRNHCSTQSLDNGKDSARAPHLLVVIQFALRSCEDDGTNVATEVNQSSCQRNTMASTDVSGKHTGR
eukprot:m.499421 g.499421  ORF g.499421 m.499421 type:complete len:136 (-) comp21825_c0_seq29:2531-2938(-)